jgi:trk system potassium uptake protein TrkA
VPWTINRLVRQIVGEALEETWRDPSGAVAAIRVQPHEGWVGQSIQDFERAVNGRVAMINRFGKGEVPLATTLLQDGDAMFVFIADEYREGMRDVVTNPPEA